MSWNIPQDFRFIILQIWNLVALLIPRLRGLRFTKLLLLLLLLLVFFSTLWYSGGSILSCRSLYSVFAIWERPHSMWGTVSWSWEHTLQLVSSTLSCNFCFLYVLVLNQLLSYRYVNRQDCVRDVLPTLKYVIWYMCNNLWVLPVLVYKFSHPGLFQDLGPPPLLSGFTGQRD